MAQRPPSSGKSGNGKKNTGPYKPKKKLRPGQAPERARSNFPEAETVAAYISESPEPLTRKEIARAFRIDESAFHMLKGMLKRLMSEGLISESPDGGYTAPQLVPEVITVEVREITEDGDALCQPVEWRHPGDVPHILVALDRGKAALAIGQKALVRLVEDDGSVLVGHML